jgi:hypothetical protein
MQKYQFIFVVTGFNIESDEQHRALESITCVADIYTYQTQGRAEIQFHGAVGASALDALKNTYKQLTKVIPGIQVSYIDEDLVSLGSIAKRMGESKKFVRRLASNFEHFPVPVGILSGGKRVWRWQDICAWAMDANNKFVVDTAKSVSGIRTCDWLNANDVLSEGAFVDRQSAGAFMLLLENDAKPKAASNKIKKKTASSSKPKKRNRL